MQGRTSAAPGRGHLTNSVGAIALAVVLALCTLQVWPATADAGRGKAKGKPKRSLVHLEKARSRGHLGRRLPAGRAARSAAVMGLNAGGLLFGGGAAATQARLAGLRAAGASVLRFDASWSGIEPLPPLGPLEPVRRFGALDEQVAASRAAGLRPLLMLGYGTPWATPGRELFTTPTDPSTFASFAAAVARRYAPDASFWVDRGLTAPPGGVLYEIWNEPNAELFLRDQQTAPSRYAELLLHAQRAIRNVDPRARITVGGLVPIGAARFLSSMLRSQPALRNEIRAIGWHPYERTGEAVVRITRQLRKDLDRMGLERTPLDVTEIGWSEEELPEPTRSRELAVALRGLGDPTLGVGLIVPYVAMDREGPGSYGLWRASGEATASVSAFASAVRQRGT